MDLEYYLSPSSPSRVGPRAEPSLHETSNKARNIFDGICYTIAFIVGASHLPFATAAIPCVSRYMEGNAELQCLPTT